jgi:uncharacterized protein YbjT (DUF2867 family)
MQALVIGATGATGRDLVNILIRSNAYTTVTIFVRRSTGLVHDKLKEVLTDFDKLEDIAQHIYGDILFSCLGTTLKAAGSKEKQWHIDYEIPLQFARRARENGVNKTVLLSAYGANGASEVFYSRMKGQLELGIEDLAFEQYIIFRPGLLERKDTDRMGERVMLPVFRFFNRMGLFRKYRPLPTAVLAEKMALVPTILPLGKHVIALDQIFVQ